MKNKILLMGFGGILLISIIAFSTGFNYNVNYYETAGGDFVSFDSIYAFLEKVGDMESEKLIYYDSNLNYSIIEDFANYFNITIKSSELIDNLNKKNLTIYIATIDSDFVDAELRNLIGGENNYDAILFHYNEEIETLYIVVKNDSVLSGLLTDLKEYYDWSEELFDENLVYYSLEDGFSTSEIIECDPTKERDSGTGGDFPERYGCLNNGVDWMCDTCVDKKTLVEFYCQDNVSVMKAYKCNSCNYGACVPICQPGWLDEYSCQKSTSIFVKGYTLMTTVFVNLIIVRAMVLIEVQAL
ncbi:MAG: hypothetical protein NT076_01135 [Candidatus Pacearchaeota archaeon]|nr:hypothetical protein [Candidatus Pacearchaeota archaeon]